MQRDIESLTRDLLRLASKDRREILGRVEALTPVDVDSDLLYEALKNYGQRAGIPMPSLPELRRQKVISTRFKHAAPIILRLIREDLKLTQELDICRAHELIIGMIARKIREGYHPVIDGKTENRSRPVTCWSLCLRLPEAAAYVDMAFPGYRQAGMLPFVGQQMVTQWKG